MRNDSVDNIRLDLNKKSVRQCLYVRCGDTRTRTIHVTIAHNGTVYDLSDLAIAEIMIKKADGRICDQGMVQYGNELQYTFRTQDINVPGEAKAMISMTFNDGAVVTSPEFSIIVYQKEITPTQEASANEYTALSQILIQAREAQDKADIAVRYIDDHIRAISDFADEARNSAITAIEAKSSAERFSREADQSKRQAESILGTVEEYKDTVEQDVDEARRVAEDARIAAIEAGESQNKAFESEEEARRSADSAESSAAEAKDAMETCIYKRGEVAQIGREAEIVLGRAEELLQEAIWKVEETEFHVNMDDGHLYYDSNSFDFETDKDMGSLLYEVKNE